MKDKIDILKNLMLEKLPAEGFIDMGIGIVGLFRSDKPHEKKPELYDPHIMILAQGKKKIYLGDKEYIYDSEHYFVETVPLPLNCEAIFEEGRPLLGIVIKVSPQIVGEIMFEMEVKPPSSKHVSRTIYNAPMSENIIDACIRLVETLDSNNAKKVLGPIYAKEILFHILNGENGEILRELSNNNREFYQIARVINDIHSNYSKPIVVQSLAKEAGMSPTAFHASFKAMTSISPLQYVKNVRLHKAKEFLQNEGEKVNTAAMRVGYESSSQFSREYKRCFGISPAKDRQSLSL